jgi:hypothetical protein
MDMDHVEMGLYAAMGVLVVCLVARFVLGTIILMKEQKLKLYQALDPSKDEGSDIDIDTDSCSSGESRETISIHDEEIKDTSSLDWVLITSSLIPSMSGEWIEEGVERETKDE